MRSLELAFIIAALFALGVSLWQRRAWRAWTRLIACLAFIFAVLQVCLEGSRWQMFPAYVVVAALGLYSCFHFTSSGRLPLLANLTAIACLLISLSLGFLLPVFSFPRPSGPFAIGTVTRAWVRTASSEEVKFGSPPERRLIVQFWYPAESGAKGKLAPYREGSDFSFRARYLALVRTHARIGVPVARAQSMYPLVFFSPMWNSGRSQNTFEFEMLAGNGFIVAAVEHPPDSAEGVFDYSSDELVRQKGREVERRAADIRFLLDRIEEIQRNDPAGLLAGRFDISRAGIFGHSFGGAAAAEVCWLDPRFKAGINMDGNLFGAVATAGIRQPFFFMYSDSAPTPALLNSANPQIRYEARMDQLDYMRSGASLLHYGGYRMVIKGSLHLNYTDRPLFSPWRRLTGAGPVDPRLAMREINAYTLAFFEKTLNGKSEPLLDGSAHPYPNVAFEAFPERATITAAATAK